MLNGVPTKMYMFLMVSVVLVLDAVKASYDSGRGFNPLVRPFSNNVGDHGYEMHRVPGNPQPINANFPDFQGMEQHELPRPLPLDGEPLPEGAHSFPPVEEEHHFLTRPVNVMVTNQGPHYLPRPVSIQPSPFHHPGTLNSPFSPRPSPPNINFQSSSGSNIFAQNVIINTRVFQVPQEMRHLSLGLMGPPSPYQFTESGQPFINQDNEFSQPSPFNKPMELKPPMTTYYNVDIPIPFYNDEQKLTPFVNVAQEVSQPPTYNKVDHELHPMFYQLFTSVANMKESVDRHYAQKMIPNPYGTVSKNLPPLTKETETLAVTNEGVLQGVGDNWASASVESDREPFHPLLA
ncbi:uncharacterized protein LOC127871321 [Dreissena polymorpha]|nr:uncharacterized protein LOC127871321 [Dreissena polymorpha]